MTEKMDTFYLNWTLSFIIRLTLLKKLTKLFNRIIMGSWCSLVSTSACQAEGRGFKSRRPRKNKNPEHSGFLFSSKAQHEVRAFYFQLSILKRTFFILVN